MGHKACPPLRQDISGWDWEDSGGCSCVLEVALCVHLLDGWMATNEATVVSHKLDGMVEAATVPFKVA
jgi:hypothetical protein